MKPQHLRPPFPSIARLCLSASFAAFGASQFASAADGTWTNDGSSTWSTPGNWSGGTIADGSGFTANFNTIDITADRTVSLDSDRTLTNLIFGDTDATTTPAGWVLDNNGDDANNLILASPTITVNALGTGKAVEISAVIEGSTGLTKAGAGTLVFSAANTYSGGTSVQANTGIIQITDAAGFGTGTVTVRPGGSGGVAQLNLAVPGSGLGSSANDPNIITNAFDLGGQGTTLADGGFGAIQNLSGFNKITGNITRRNTGGTTYNIVSNNHALELSGTLSNVVSGTRIFNLGGSGDIVVTGAIVNGSTGTTTAVAKDGAGSLTLTGNKTFTGGLAVRAGAVFARSSGGALGGAGTGAVTLGNTSGSDAVTLLLATSATFNNPITVAAGSSGAVTINNFANYGPTLAGPITLNKDLVLAHTNLSGTFNFTIGGPVSGTGGLLVNASNPNNTITFSGAGGHEGATTVNGGVFALTGSLNTSSVEIKNNATLSGSGYIGGDLTIRSGARHALAVAATDGAQITRAIGGILTLDSGNILNLTAAAPPAAGTYVLATAEGGITGTPTVINQTGVSGVVTVDTISSPNRLLLTVSAGFSSWITGTFANGTVPGGQQGANDDPDGDGVSNLLEYAVAGFDPTVGNASPGTFSGNALSFDKRQPLAADLTYSIEESTDLGSTDPWSPVTPTVNNSTTISYTLPGGPPTDFLRLKVETP